MTVILTPIYTLDRTAVMIDWGSQTTKAGFAGEEDPVSIFPTVVGHAKYDEMVGASVEHHYYGTDVIPKRGLLHYKYPIKRGGIEDWD